MGQKIYLLAAFLQLNFCDFVTSFILFFLYTLISFFFFPNFFISLVIFLSHFLMTCLLQSHVPVCYCPAQTFMVRPYSPADEPSVYEICRKTCDDGSDGSHGFPDHPNLIGDKLVGAFVTLSPEVRSFINVICVGF